VRPGYEYDALCSELTEAFLALENADTGGPAVRWVRRADELYDGPRLGELPDLFIEWEHHRPIKALRSPRIGTIDRAHRGSRTGDHLAGGLVIGHGPRLARLAPGGLRTLDVAPTLLDFFGIDRIGECEGKSALLS
jgi:predicted AlkP superfamily phosphohydrolase/phosphomutase